MWQAIAGDTLCSSAVQQRPSQASFVSNFRVSRALAGAGGIEPPNGGIKIRCLTAWLRPISDENDRGEAAPDRGRADHSGGTLPDQRLKSRFIPLISRRFAGPAQGL